jgi:hypothetical protein
MSKNVAHYQLLTPACLNKFTSFALNQSKVACFQNKNYQPIKSMQMICTPLLGIAASLIRD